MTFKEKSNAPKAAMSEDAKDGDSGSNNNSSKEDGDEKEDGGAEVSDKDVADSLERAEVR